VEKISRFWSRRKVRRFSNHVSAFAWTELPPTRKVLKSVYLWKKRVTGVPFSHLCDLKYFIWPRRGGERRGRQERRENLIGTEASKFDFRLQNKNYRALFWFIKMIRSKQWTINLQIRLFYYSTHETHQAIFRPIPFYYPHKALFSTLPNTNKLLNMILRKRDKHEIRRFLWLCTRRLVPRHP